MKLPYDYIVDHAFHLIKLMACIDNNGIIFMDELSDYLTASGWSDFEFDNETLGRIDLNWEPQLN